MLKSNLAKELRQRQYKLGEVPKDIIDSLPDDILIDCYITCPCCQEKQIDNPAQLERIIKESQNADDFLERCNAVADAKSKLLNSANEIVKNTGF
jgi:hypothetical protein